VPTHDVDAGWLRRTARDHGYATDGFERAYRLAEILRNIGEDPWLGDRLVLKGGTCINLFHDNLPRLSVDMDLNYVGSLDRTSMLEERPQVERTLEEAVHARGYEVDEETRSYAGRKVRLLYTNVHGHRDSIRADLNYLMRLPLYGVERHDLPVVFELDPAHVPALALEDVYGGKLKALASRADPRDLFDAARLFDGRLSPEPRKLRAAFLFYGHMDDATLRLIDLDRVEALTDEDMRRYLYPMLRADEQPTAEELRAAVLPHLRSMLERTEDEIRYGTELERGRHVPELLFRGLPVPRDMALHPAALWRARNPHGKDRGEGERD
jgi:predicted nucleotidyltransferase component of viral defense system